MRPAATAVNAKDNPNITHAYHFCNLVKLLVLLAERTARTHRCLLPPHVPHDRNDHRILWLLWTQVIGFIPSCSFRRPARVSRGLHQHSGVLGRVVVFGCFITPFAPGVGVCLCVGGSPPPLTSSLAMMVRTVLLTVCPALLTISSSRRLCCCVVAATPSRRRSPGRFVRGA
jgi:hypothetical protein